MKRYTSKNKKYAAIFEHVQNTFIVGVSFSKNKEKTNLIFDLGSYSLCFSKYKNKNS